MLEQSAGPDAAAQFEGALAIAVRRYTPDHPFYGEVAKNYAGFLRKAGRKTEAKAMEARSPDHCRIRSTVDRSELWRQHVTFK